MKKKGVIGELFKNRIQLELLFSTGAIVSLANLPSILRYNLYIFVDKLDISLNVMLQFFYFFLTAGINTLIVGFGLNIFFRVLVLSYIGIESIYPNGIKKEKLKYSSYSESKIINNSNSQNIIDFCEKIASFSFSISIFLIIKFVGIAIVNIIIFSIFNLLGLNLFEAKNVDRNNDILNFIFLFSILLSLGIFDYIFNVLLRKFDIVSKIYYPLYRISNIITLNFLIRKQLLILNSNLGRFLTGFIILIYFLLGIFAVENNFMFLKNKFDSRKFYSVDESRKFIFSTSAYDDIRDKEVAIPSVTIPSQYIKDDILPIFFVYKAWYDIDMNEIYKPVEIDNDSTILLQNETIKRLETFGKYINLRIDDSIQSNLKWYYQVHPMTKQLGFVTYVPISELSKGVHNIGFKLNYSPKNIYVNAKNNQELYVNFVKM